ncbi:MAG: histidine phosphatase family protein [Clostridia bacterium]|nr:histidine phosphatase family protein [Clostridia bacterium]
MTRMIFVRHGESEANLRHAFAGWTNAHLTEKGHEQAQKTAEYLKRYHIDVAYASDLRRAYDTAKHIADAQGIEVKPEEGLREIFAGDWENRLFDEIATQDAEAWQVWRQDIGRAQPAGGESTAALQARVAETVDRIRRAHEGKTILIGTHATPIRVMECLWRGLPLAEAKTINWVPNASVTVIEYEGDTPRIVCIGEYSYMGDLITGLPRNV